MEVISCDYFWSYEGSVAPVTCWGQISPDVSLQCSHGDLWQLDTVLNQKTVSALSPTDAHTPWQPSRCVSGAGPHTCGWGTGCRFCCKDTTECLLCWICEVEKIFIENEVKPVELGKSLFWFYCVKSDVSHVKLSKSHICWYIVWKCFMLHLSPLLLTQLSCFFSSFSLLFYLV